MGWLGTANVGSLGDWCPRFQRKLSTKVSRSIPDSQFLVPTEAAIRAEQYDLIAMRMLGLSSWLVQAPKRWVVGCKR
jgi:hypothetical protein